MYAVLLVIQLVVSIALVAVILMQKSDGGALGIGGGSGGGLFSPRSAGDALTRTTTILAVVFFVTSMALTLLALHGRPQGSILSTPAAPVTAPAGKPSGLPEVPGIPSPK